MKKEKLCGLSNSKDSYWFRFKNTSETEKQLSEIFEELAPARGELNESCFILDEPTFLAYFIFDKETHVILRKLRKYETIKEKLLNKFSF